MKRMLLGLAVGVGIGYWVGSSSHEPSSEQASVPLAPPTKADAVPVDSQVQKTVAAPVVPPKKTDSSNLPTEPAKIEVAKDVKPVPQLFTGAVEGFPKLDEKTQKTLDGVHNKVAANQPENALSELEAAYQSEPQNPYLAVELAMMNAELFQNTKRSEEILKDFLRVDPNSKMVAAAYADFLTHQGRDREAGVFFAQAAAGENSPTEAKTQLGHHLMRTQEFGKAIEIYSQAYDETGRDVQAKASNNESMLFAKRRHGEAALDMANAYLRAGDSEQARKFGSEAQSLLDASHPQVQQFQKVLEQQGRRAQKKVSE